MSAIRKKYAKAFVKHLQPWEYEPSGASFTLRGLSKNSGRKLVHFIHGNGLNSLTYAPFLRLVGKHYDLFLHDTQGHGDSEPGTSFAGWQATADIAATLFSERQALADKRPAIGMGHSFGAILSLLMAAAHPKLFTGLILLDPVLMPAHYILATSLARHLGLAHRLPMAYHARRRRDAWPSREAAWEYLQGRGMFKTWDEDALTAYLDYALSEKPDGALQLKCPPWLESEVFGSAPYGLWQAVRKVRVPTRIFFGSETYHWIRPAVERASRLNPLISGHELSGVGHCFMLEKPHYAFSAVKPALRDLLSPL